MSMVALKHPENSLLGTFYVMCLDNGEKKKKKKKYTYIAGSKLMHL